MRPGRPSSVASSNCDEPACAKKSAPSRTHKEKSNTFNFPRDLPRISVYISFDTNLKTLKDIYLWGTRGARLRGGDERRGAEVRHARQRRAVQSSLSRELCVRLVVSVWCVSTSSLFEASCVLSRSSCAPAYVSHTHICMGPLVCSHRCDAALCDGTSLGAHADAANALKALSVTRGQREMSNSVRRGHPLARDSMAASVSAQHRDTLSVRSCSDANLDRAKPT